MSGTVHQSTVGTYHADPKAEVAWTINDTRGYLDGGPACDECGACECACPHCGSTTWEDVHSGACCQTRMDDLTADTDDPDPEACIGLSFAFVCLDGGDALCEPCAEKAGITIVPCDCAQVRA